MRGSLSIVFKKNLITSLEILSNSSKRCSHRWGNGADRRRPQSNIPSDFFDRGYNNEIYPYIVKILMFKLYVLFDCPGPEVTTTITGRNVLHDAALALLSYLDNCLCKIISKLYHGNHHIQCSVIG